MEPVLILLGILAVAYLAIRSSRRRLEDMSRARREAEDAGDGSASGGDESPPPGRR